MTTFLISVAKVAKARLLDLALISVKYAAVFEMGLAERRSSIATSSNLPML